MSFCLPKISKGRFGRLLKIAEDPSPRQVFENLLLLVRELPLAPFELAEFLRLSGYDELFKVKVADSMLPFFIAELQNLLGKTTEELLEIFCELKKREWPVVVILPLGAVSEEREPRNQFGFNPLFEVLSFHDPPTDGCANLLTFP